MIRLVNHTDTTAELYPYFDVTHGLVSVCIVKATWRYQLDGRLTALPDANSIIVQDNFFGFPNASSITHAQENMPLKQFAELICYGTIYPPNKHDREMIAELKVEFIDGGCWKKTLWISGSRFWEKCGEVYRCSEPEIIKPLPLRYEHAYGGIMNGKRYLANPAGMGFVNGQMKGKPFLPQIEYEKYRIDDIHQQPPPAGFGPLPVSWMRAKVFQQVAKSTSLPGNRASLAPLDQCFNRSFSGGEVIELTGLHRDQDAVTIKVPKLKPHLTLSYHAGEHYAAMECDTIIIDTQSQQLSLLWRQRLHSKTKYKSCFVQIEH